MDSNGVKVTPRRPVVTGRSVFISGPMSGKPLYNVSAFTEAHARINVLSPRKVYDPAIEYLRSTSEHDHEYWIYQCIVELMTGAYGTRYQVLVQLPGWEESAGARLERDVALACGIEVVTLEEALDATV